MAAPSTKHDLTGQIQVSARAISPDRIITLLLLGSGLAATGWIYRDTFQWLWRMWNGSDDHSHGFLVPFVAALILWVRRDGVSRAWNNPGSGWWLVIGVGALLSGLAVRLLGVFTSILTFEGISIIPFLFGVVVIAAGGAVGRWSLPALLYLSFMVPLPQFLGGKLSGVLQSISTFSSVFSLQSLGVPAVAEGNIIHLTVGTIGVAEACSGLRMLYAFFALTVAACLLVERSLVEKVLILISAVPIAIAVNCLRITATGLAYEYGDPNTAEHIFHEVAGWLMMPIGLLLLFVVLAILGRLIIPAERDALPAR